MTTTRKVLSAAALRRLAAKAKAATPGPWVAGHVGTWSVMAGPLKENRPGFIRGGRGAVAEVDDLDFPLKQQRANAHYIAAAHPETVAALVSEVLALRAEVARLKGES